jgi:predicted ATP-binding protein involved in virulence
MKIDRLVLENFRNFEHLDASFVRGVNLLLGKNGSGKTALLEAVNVALGGFFARQDAKMQRAISLEEVRLSLFEQRIKRAPFASVTAYGNVVERPWARHFSSDTGKNDSREVQQIGEYGLQIMEAFHREGDRTVAPVIAYYSTQRLFKDAYKSSKQSYDAAIGRRNGYLQCLKDNAIKGTLVEWLGNAVVRRATQQIQDIPHTDQVLENVEAAIKQTLTAFLELPEDFSLRIFSDPDFDFELFIQYGHEAPLPLNYYSDGFRNLVYLVIDIVWRASQLNPWLTLEALGQQVGGCITLDEVDLHLHPRWQAKAIPLLQRLFPNIQFFITTHSPTVIINFRPRYDEHGHALDALYVIDNQQCYPITDCYGADVNRVLEGAMDASSRPQEVAHLLHQFQIISGNPEATEEDYQILRQLGTQLQTILDGTDAKRLQVDDVLFHLNLTSP